MGKEQKEIYQVKIIVDANIVFSGILNTKGKIGDLLINSHKLIDFIAPDFLRTEIRKHYDKLVRLSKLNLEQVAEAEFQICKDIRFISEEQVSAINWGEAYELVKDIDPKDIQYIAFSLHFNRKIWSGDKTLMLGLKKKGFESWVKTDELYRFREERRLFKKRHKK